MMCPTNLEVRIQSSEGCDSALTVLTHCLTVDVVLAGINVDQQNFTPKNQITLWNTEHMFKD